MLQILFTMASTVYVMNYMTNMGPLAQSLTLIFDIKLPTPCATASTACTVHYMTKYGSYWDAACISFSIKFPNPYKMASTAYLVHYITNTDYFETQPVSYLTFRYILPIKWFLHFT